MMMWKTCRWAAIALLLCLPPAAAPAGTAGGPEAQPKAGLMWNRTGLPAVFPLQVKTPAGADYYLTLTEAATGQDAVAAYVTGGAFFKILVPPGTFSLRFASGQGWRGEAELFGPGSQTRLYELPEPLTFEIRGFGVKAGHIITLAPEDGGRMARVTVKVMADCQTLQTVVPRFVIPDQQEEWDRFRHGREWSGRWGRHVSRSERQLYEDPLFPDEHTLRLPQPRLSARNRPCG